MLDIRRHYLCHQIKTKFCVVAGLQEMVLWFKLCQNRLWFLSCGGRNLPFPIDLAIFPLIYPIRWERANFDSPQLRNR